MMKRGLINACAAMSLLLAILVLIDLCTHPWRQNIYTAQTSRDSSGGREVHYETIQTGGGEVLLLYTIEVPLIANSPQGALPQGRFEYSTAPPGGVFGENPTIFGFGVISQEFAVDISGHHANLKRWGICIPSWFLLLLFLVLPTLWVRRYRKRIPPGSCQVCGYDLRASPERCPECGNTDASAGASA